MMSVTQYQESKTILLWAAPRCVSTAFEKTFACRKDTDVVHEPFCDVFFFSQWRRSLRFGDCQELWNYGATQAIDLIHSHEKPIVFVKDHAYQALPYIDHSFLIDKINTFIIRNPLEVLASWYRVGELPTEEEFGYTALLDLWTLVTQELKQPTFVVNATQFRQHPEQTLRDYCQMLQVEFKPQMLEWQSGKLKDWSEREAEFHQKWHKTLDNSKGILPPDNQVNPLAISVADEHREMLARAQEIYEMLA